MCLKPVIEPSFLGWCDGVMDSARDFDLLGESVPQVQVSVHTLALSGISITSIYLYIYVCVSVCVCVCVCVLRSLAF